MLAAYTVWYVLYDLWLLPDGRLDAWVSQSVASVSGGLLSLLGLEVTVAERTVALSASAGVKIVNGCNGLSTIGLFVGFVLAYPGRAWRRLAFVPLGIAVICTSNVVRIVVLAVTQRHWPPMFESLHEFGLTTIFYAVVFGLWVLWARYGGASESTVASA